MWFLFFVRGGAFRFGKQMFYNVFMKRERSLACVDWNAIRQDYITDESCSYRKLAKKYGVSYTSIGAKARQEGWAEQRAQYLNETLSKTLTALSREQAKKATRLQTVADKLLDKIEEIVDNYDASTLSRLDSQVLKHITGALKDLKDIQMIKSDADMREQEARIANLRKQADKEDNVASEIEVVFMAGPEEWNE